MSLRIAGDAFKGETAGVEVDKSSPPLVIVKLTESMRKDYVDTFMPSMKYRLTHSEALSNRLHGLTNARLGTYNLMYAVNYEPDLAILRELLRLVKRLTELTLDKYGYFFLRDNLALYHDIAIGQLLRLGNKKRYLPQCSSNFRFWFVEEAADLINLVDYCYGCFPPEDEQNDDCDTLVHGFSPVTAATSHLYPEECEFLRKCRLIFQQLKEFDGMYICKGHAE
jgi:hypothetical protein